MRLRFLFPKRNTSRREEGDELEESLLAATLGSDVLRESDVDDAGEDDALLDSEGDVVVAGASFSQPRATRPPPQDDTRNVTPMLSRTLAELRPPDRSTGVGEEASGSKLLDPKFADESPTGVVPLVPDVCEAPETDGSPLVVTGGLVFSSETVMLRIEEICGAGWRPMGAMASSNVV